MLSRVLGQIWGLYKHHVADTLANILQIMDDRAQELALASNTAAEKVRYLNLALNAVLLDHDFEDQRSSTNLSFTRHATRGWNTVTAPTDWWAPIELNNADNDYKFWFMRPDHLRNLNRGDKFVAMDIDYGFAKDGTDVLIWHDTTETLTLKYYSSLLVYDVSASSYRSNFVAADTSDTFRLRNDDIIITRALMFLMEKEPDSDKEYIKLKAYYDNLIKLEKLHYPSQRLEPIEELQFIG